MEETDAIELLQLARDRAQVLLERLMADADDLKNCRRIDAKLAAEGLARITVAADAAGQVLAIARKALQDRTGDPSPKQSPEIHD